MTKTRTTVTGDGGEQTRVSARLDGRSVMTAVRAFYLDIAEWADDDPAPMGTIRGALPGQRQRRLPQEGPITAQIPDGPTDPGTAAGAAGAGLLGGRRAWPHAELLAAAESARSGQLFTAAGVTLRRAVLKTQTTGRVWAEDPDSGGRRDLNFEEHRGFWTWAVVEVLRHTGIRIEELTELSHHSLIQYRVPATGERSRCCRSPRPRPTRSGFW